MKLTCFTVPRERLPALGAFLLVCAAFFAGLSGLPGKTGGMLPRTSAFLREGLLETISLETMPLSALLVRRNFDGEPMTDPAAAKVAVFALLFFLCFDTARRIGGGVRGGLLALGAAVFYLNGDAEERLFAAAVLLFADIAAARAGRENVRSALAAGAAAGAALLIRSDFYPPFIFYLMYELLASGGAFRARSLRAGALLLPALLLLVPRLVFSARALGYPLLFEYGSRAEGTLVVAGLNSIYTFDGDFRALAGLGAEDSVWGWFIGRVAAHPEIFLRTALVRLWQAVKMNPLLLAAAVAGFAASKRKRRAGMVLALAGVYLALRALLPLEARFFYPLWWLLLPLAGQLAVGWRTVNTRDDIFDPVLKTAFTAVIAVSLWAAGVTVRGALWGKTADELEQQVLAGAVTEPRLVSYTVRRAILRDSGGLALRLLARSAELGIPGDRATFYVLNSTSAPGDIPGWPAAYVEYGVKVLKEVETGEERAAYRTFLEMEKKWEGEKCVARGTAYGFDAGIAARLAREDNTLTEQVLLKALVYWPERKRAGLAARLDRLIGPNFPLRLYAAESHARSGDRAAAEKAADKALRAASGEGQLLDCASAYVAAGRPGKAAVLLEKLAAGGLSPGTAAAAITIAAAAGRPDLGRSFLLKAGGEPAGQPENSCGLLLAASRLPGQSGCFSRTAMLELAAGLKREAAATAECALGSGLSEEETIRAALLIQDSGKPARAAEIFRDLSRSYPAQKELLYYAGVAEILAGNYAGAVPVLERYAAEAGGGGKAESALAYAENRLASAK